MGDTKKRIVEIVYDFFIASHDFNGIPLTDLAEKTETPYADIIDTIIELVNEKTLSIQNGDNPHIIRVCHYDLERQITLLEEARNNETIIVDEFPVPGGENFKIAYNTHNLCAYPSIEYLSKARDVSEFNNRPFTKELALGMPHLTPAFFELDTLDRYYKDPRYAFKLEDYSGKISYEVDEDQNPLLKEKDQVFLQTFGLGVDESDDRVVVVYLRYLDDLTSEHQIFWKSKQIKHGCKIIAEYYDNTVLGEWTNSCSLFRAFLGEQEAINTLTQEIFDKPLFLKTFDDYNRPKGFNFLFVPTLKNYEDFVSLLDKMMSENINKDFFNSKVELFNLEADRNGRQIKRNKGTIKLLEEWLPKVFTPGGGYDVFSEIFPIFNRVRKERQSPAHKIAEDFYDKKFIETQRQVMREAYQAMYHLRNIFQFHPKGQNIVVPDWLDKCEIKQF